MSGFHKMLQVRPPTIIHRLGKNEESWLLDGVSKQRGAALTKLGWRWVRGSHSCPGVWETTDLIQANEFIKRNVPVIEYRMGAKQDCEHCDGTGIIKRGYMTGHECSCLNENKLSGESDRLIPDNWKSGCA